MKIFHEGLTIVPARLGNDAGMIGSAALALDKAEASDLVAPNDDVAAEQSLAVEFEKAGEMCAANEERQPVAVVRPHLVVGNGIERRPERRPLRRSRAVRLRNRGRERRCNAGCNRRGTGNAVRRAASAPSGVTPSSSKISRRADLQRRLARIDLAAGSVDFARAETALLADEENFSISHNEEEGGANARLPDCPIGHVAQTLISCRRRGIRT